MMPIPADPAHHWQVLAIRYGTAELAAHHLTLDIDLHNQPGTLDYFVWLVRGPNGSFLFDTGWQAEEGARRGRTLLQSPVEALARLGHPASEIRNVLLSHLHYDHAGNLTAFPNATFYLQDREMAYGTGRCMGHATLRKPFSSEDIVSAVRLVYAGRVVFHEGDAVLAPGLSLHLIGGHSRGLQALRVETAAGVVVLASDALHLARYLSDGDVFPLFADHSEVLEGYRRLKELAGADGIIVPGHDPCVTRKFPRLLNTDPNTFLLSPV
jgi:glyoxylase-like metal-dependent hydrolase (beta-lactamase superfamily II)